MELVQPMTRQARPKASGFASWAPLWLCLPLMLMVALRGDTRDTFNYIEAFRATTEFPWDPLAFYAAMGMEWGFGITSWALNAIGLGPSSLFFLFSLGTFYFLHKAALRVKLDLIEVSPYYLGSFFLLQQLMQIRQGLATTLVLSIVVLVGSPQARVWRTVPATLLAASMHLTSALPLLGVQVLNRLMPRPGRWQMALWLALVMLATAALARAFMSLDAIESLGRLSLYAADEEYSDARDLLDVANVRATLVLLLLLFGATTRLLRTRSYVLMLGLYAAHLGLRFGFFDFLILSGRLSTALGIVEILLLPMLMKARIRSVGLRLGIGLIYFLVHALATLLVQAPYLIDDYFTPLYAHHAEA